MKKLIDTFKLHNGNEIPCLGYGTWKSPNDETTIKAVTSAIEAGYRHIDAAAIYENEKSVGTGIKNSGIKREDLFITSKLWNADRRPEKVENAIEQTLNDLQTDYLDLYLIHWPANKKQFDDYETINAETFLAMNEFVKKGKIKNIGVCNFLSHHLDSLINKTNLVPVINQIEYHVGYRQMNVILECRKHNIVVEGWSPLGSGSVLSDERIQAIANKYNKTPAQICLRYLLENDVLPLTKSVTPSRIIENTKIFDFEMTRKDISFLDAIENLGFSGLEPDKADF